VGNGGTAFCGILKIGTGDTRANTAQGLWTNVATGAPGSLRLVARQGSAAPGVPGATYRGITQFVLNDGGRLFWNTTLAGVSAAHATALFGQSSLGDGPHLLVQAGQKITGVGTVISYQALLGASPSGDALVGGPNGYGTGRSNGGAIMPVLLTLNAGRHAIAVAGPAHPLEIVCLSGQPVPVSTGLEGMLWKAFGQPSAGASGTLAFRATLGNASPATRLASSNDTALFLRPAEGGFALLAREGDDAPGLPGLHYTAFSDPHLNADGDALFFANLADAHARSAGQALFWQAEGGAPVLVARTGDAAPGLDGARFLNFSGAMLPSNASGQELAGPVFLASLLNAPHSGAVTARNNSALWAVDSTGQLTLLARTGGLIGGQTLQKIGAFEYVSGSAMQARTAGAATQAIYRATFTDHTVAIVKVAIP
jgi:hypothetical protein